MGTPPRVLEAFSKEQNRWRSAILATIKAFDVLVDTKTLLIDELTGKKEYREKGINLEMNGGQRPRQLWLKEGDFNTRFFQLMKNDRK